MCEDRINICMITFSKFLETKLSQNTDYVIGWDEIVPAFHKWTRKDITPEQWALNMITKLAEQQPTTASQDYRLQGNKDALASFLRNGQLDYIGTKGHYDSDPSSPSPFSSN